MTIEDSLNSVLEKIENDPLLNEVAALFEKHPDKKDEIIEIWAEVITQAAKHPFCKEHIFNYIHVLYEEMTGDVGELCDMFPSYRRFEKDLK